MQNNRFSRVDFMNLDFDMCIVLTFLPCSIFVSMRVQWTLDSHLSCISCSDNRIPITMYTDGSDLSKLWNHNNTLRTNRMEGTANKKINIKLRREKCRQWTERDGWKCNKNEWKAYCCTLWHTFANQFATDSTHQYTHTHNHPNMYTL